MKPSKQVFYVILMSLMGACQSESLDIRAPYRIKLNTASPGTTLKQHQPYSLSLELLTDSYFAQYGYQLVYYQQVGLGRLSRSAENHTQPVLQNVPVALPLGVSAWQYTPEALGTSQVILIARQARGYTRPDTVRINFQIIP